MSAAGTGGFPDGFLAAFGAAECARRARVREEESREWVAQVTPLLAAQGYRIGGENDSAARFVWLKIDDRTIDGGLCKMWVAPLGT